MSKADDAVRLSAPPLLAWRVHPARARPAMAAVTVLFIAGVACLTHAAYHAFWLTMLAVLFLSGAAGEFLFPSHYVLTAEGASRQSWLGVRQQVAWPDVLAVYRFEDGLKLSTAARPGPLEPHRGLYLRWGGERDAVLAIVDERATARRRVGDGDERSSNG